MKPQKFRSACGKVFDSVGDMTEASRWNRGLPRPKIAPNQSTGRHISVLLKHKCATQREDQWVTGFQKHRYAHALWHNKRDIGPGLVLPVLSSDGAVRASGPPENRSGEKVCEGHDGTLRLTDSLDRVPSAVFAFQSL